MKNKVLEYLNGLVSDNTTKAELDLIEYAKKAVRGYVEKESKVKKVGFVPPTLDEVAEYIKEKGYNISASQFCEYYEEANWHDRNGKPVKNWKLKLLVWHKPVEKDTFIHNGYSEGLMKGLITDLDKVEL